MFNRLKFAGISALGVSMMAGLPAWAQEAAETAAAAVPTDMVFIMNSLIMIIGGILVFWMAAGFAMLEAGLVRSKNATMQLMKNITVFSVACIMYYVIGYSVMYPGDGWMIQGILGALGTAQLEAVGVEVAGLDDYSYASTSSDFFFQVMFCATTASIVSGALAERIKLIPFLVFTLVLTALIYPIQASWKWGGGFLDEMGFLDFAGSTVVHSVGGWAALVGALILGPRLGKYKDGRTIAMPGNNLALATLGTFILWMGWFGFNGASQLAFSSVGDASDVGRVMANTNAAAAGGAVVALILTMVLYKKADLTMVLNGALAGLVSITAEPLTPGLGAATLIGAVGGAIVVFAVPFLDKLKIDDVVGAVPVHLFAGIWGTIAVVFTNADASLWVQIQSIVIVGLFTVIASLVVWFIVKAVFGLRVSAEDEMLGLDKAELGMEAYPEFVKS
ncbi:ammonium transporter [Gemmobacter megaterium]|uniref:Ammonium transporter n=2 Tax=Gemmobacter megaterium TaxID=1086013 RepID=A0A1N7PGI8_9RHOB|nr:ammonium transporter [Gemmobacter megaterium]SIT09773.1 ammonium transporter [Gemmobacter megaterium]